MAENNENASDSMEHECMLCWRAQADPELCGYKLEQEGLCVHVFCLLFANGLFQRLGVEGRIIGFVPEDIRETIWQAAQKDCFVCGKSGATITCCQEGCSRSFHLPCAAKGRCVTQYTSQYRSFCFEHRPEQAVDLAPEGGTTCLFCLDPVEDRMSYRTMVCPVCKHAWFHRDCIQGHALRAGMSCFQCPLCRDNNLFILEMFNMGIRIPIRRPLWESGQAYAALSERHSRCDASECLCPGGREQAEQEGPWQLLLCHSCAAQGTHRCCSNLTDSLAIWECNSCAGLGNASSASTELTSPSTASQSASQASHSSAEMGTTSPSTSSQVAQGLSHSCPVLEGSSPSSLPGPERMRKRLRLQRQAQRPYTWPRRHHDRSHAPVTSVEISSTRSQEELRPCHSCPALQISGLSTTSQSASETSHGSAAPETISPSTGSQVALSGLSHSSPKLAGSSCSSPSRPMRMRNGSRLQRRAQKPYTRPRRHRDSSRAPATSAGSSSTLGQEELRPCHSGTALQISSLGTASQQPSGSSCDVPAPETISPSTTSQAAVGLSHSSPVLAGSSPSTHPGPGRRWKRSCLQRCARKICRWLRRFRDRRRGPEASAESSSSPRQEAPRPPHSSLALQTSSPSTASQLPARSSCSSPASMSGRYSTLPGPVQMQDSSCLQHQAQNPYSCPGHHHGTSRAPSPTAGPDPPPPAP